MYTKPANTQIDRAKLAALRVNLPHGAIGDIAEQLGISRNAVADVFKGKWHNQEVIDLAIAKIEAKKAKVQEIEQRIDKVLSGV